MANRLCHFGDLSVLVHVILMFDANVGVGLKFDPTSLPNAYLELSFKGINSWDSDAKF